MSNGPNYDRIKVWLTAAALVATVGGGAIGLYVQGRQEMTQLAERVDRLIISNQRNYEVFDKLAQSVNRLSESVARLDERTRALEEEE